MNNRISWERKVLSNGLTVLLYPRISGMTAQLSVAIKYGSNDDSKENSGTAHFLEHMLVGGSQGRINLHNEIEMLGGCSIFETTPEFTYCAVNIFPEKLAEASKVLSGLLFDSSFDKEKLEIERKVILNEIADIADDPTSKIDETLAKCLFKSHPIRRPISGTKQTVSQTTLNQLEGTHRSRYAPQNMIIILTGSFSDEDVEKALRNFQDKENKNIILKKPHEIEKTKPKKGAKIEKMGIAQAYLTIGARTVPSKDNATSALDLLSVILGIGESSRLFVELREKRALTYDVGSTHISGLDFGYFAIDCSVKPKSLEQTEKLIRKELEKIKTEKVTEIELNKAKNQTLASLYRDFDSPTELPRLIAEVEIQYKNENALLEYTKKIQTTTNQDLIEAANQYLQNNNYSIVTLTSKK